EGGDATTSEYFPPNRSHGAQRQLYAGEEYCGPDPTRPASGVESNLLGAAHGSASSYYDERSQTPLSPKQPMSRWALSGRVPAKFLGYLPPNPNQPRHSEPLNDASNQPSIYDQPWVNVHDLSSTNTTIISPQAVKARRATVAPTIPLRSYDEDHYPPTQDKVLLGSMAAFAVSTSPSYEYTSGPPRGPGIDAVDTNDGWPRTGAVLAEYECDGHKGMYTWRVRTLEMGYLMLTPLASSASQGIACSMDALVSTTSMYRLERTVILPADGCLVCIRHIVLSTSSF
ncbi:hypothetical protein BJV74DRAFT_822405, partial [Russula compacta]